MMHVNQHVHEVEKLLTDEVKPVENEDHDISYYYEKPLE